jgi:hypothetical protein
MPATGSRYAHGRPPPRLTPAAEIDARRLVALLAQRPDQRAGIGQSPVPGREIALLGADVKRHAEAEPGMRGLAQQPERVTGAAPELAGQRPVCPGPVRADAHVHSRAGSLTDHLVQLSPGVHGEDAHSAATGVGDVALLLDGVAERQARRIDAELQAPVDLAGTGDVKAGSKVS